MNKKYTVNIGRELGCGGYKISKILADKLNIECYDKRLITMTAKKSGLRKELLEKVDENDQSFWRWFSSPGSVFSFGDCYASPNYSISDFSLFDIQSNVIKEIAGKESCIFLGRCADFILRHNSNNINIFIYADEDFKLEEIKNRHKGESKNLTSEMHRSQKKRADYYTFYTGHTWGDKANYDLCINSSLLGIEGTAECLYDYIQKRLKNLNPS